MIDTDTFHSKYKIIRFYLIFVFIYLYIIIFIIKNQFISIYLYINLSPLCIENIVSNKKQKIIYLIERNIIQIQMSASLRISAAV